jgi:hypothetical protein
LNKSNTTTYKNTAKHDVSRFLQSLQPTPLESLYLRKSLQKGSLSMRDVKLFLEYVVLRASEGPLKPHQCSALGSHRLAIACGAEQPLTGAVEL